MQISAQKNSYFKKLIMDYYSMFYEGLLYINNTLFHFKITIMHRMLKTLWSTIDKHKFHIPKAKSITNPGDGGAW